MEKVTVKYQVSKEYCSCCGREFTEEELGGNREFDINIQDVFEWAQWRDSEDIYEEEVSGTVFEYLYNTIHFYALEGNEKLHISDDEIKRVEIMVREKIKNM